MKTISHPRFSVSGGLEVWFPHCLRFWCGQLLRLRCLYTGWGFFSPTFSYSGHKSEMDSLSTDQKEGNKDYQRFLWTTAACACTWQCIKHTSGCSPVWLAVRIFSIIPAYGYVGCPDGHISEARHQQQREIKQAVKRLSRRPSLPLNSL